MPHTSQLSNKQRFIKNLTFLFSSRILSAILTLAANIYLIERLGASIFGEFAFGVTLTGYFISIADTGLSPFGETAAAKNKNISNIAEIINNISSARLLLSFISLIIIISIGLIFFKNAPRQKNIIIVFSLLPLIYSFNFSWALRGMEKNHVILFTNFINSLLFLLGILLIVKNLNWYLAAALLYLAGNLATVLIQTNYIEKTIKKIKINFAFNAVKKTVKASLPFGIFSWVSILYISYPIIFLKIFNNNKNIGYYYITYKIIGFIFIMLNLTGNAFIPVISDAVKENDGIKESKLLSELIRFIYTFSLPAIFGGYAISSTLIIELFGIKLITAAGLLRIMVWSILPVGISSALISYLMVKNARKYLVKSASFASLGGFIFAFFFIKYYGLNEAAYSLIFIELLMTGSLLYFTYKIVKIKFNAINFIKVLLSSLIMGFIVIELRQKLILSIVIGMIVYAVLSLLLKTVGKKDIMEIKELLSVKKA